MLRAVCHKDCCRKHRLRGHNVTLESMLNCDKLNPAMKAQGRLHDNAAATCSGADQNSATIAHKCTHQDALWKVRWWPVGGRAHPSQHLLEHRVPYPRMLCPHMIQELRRNIPTSMLIERRGPPPAL